MLPTRTITPVPSTSPTPGSSTPPGKAGIVLTARPDSDGSFIVDEVVTLPTAMTEIVLRPPAIADVGAGFERLRPAATDVEVNAGGQSLVIPDGSVPGAVTLRWDSPTAQLRLSYRLTQVSVASAPSRAGRSLAAFGSLLAHLPADLPVMVVVGGKHVLSLTCPQLSLARMACGAGAAPKLWTRRPIPFDRSCVLVQYDRPSRSR